MEKKERKENKKDRSNAFVAYAQAETEMMDSLRPSLTCKNPMHKCETMRLR